MKVQLIERIGRYAVMVFLITGICLLASKKIIPIGMIALLLLAKGTVSFLFRILITSLKVLILLLIIGLLVA